MQKINSHIKVIHITPGQKDSNSRKAIKDISDAIGNDWMANSWESISELLKAGNNTAFPLTDDAFAKQQTDSMHASILKSWESALKSKPLKDIIDMIDLMCNENGVSFHINKGKNGNPTTICVDLRHYFSENAVKEIDMEKFCNEAHNKFLNQDGKTI